MARKAEMRSELVSPEHSREHASPEIEVQKAGRESHPANHRGPERMCWPTFVLFHAPFPALTDRWSSPIRSRINELISSEPRIKWLQNLAVFGKPFLSCLRPCYPLAQGVPRSLEVLG